MGSLGHNELKTPFLWLFFYHNCLICLSDKAESAKTSGEKAESSQQSTENEEDNLWAGPAKVIDEKSREEEFDEYFEDMFL